MFDSIFDTTIHSMIHKSTAYSKKIKRQKWKITLKLTNRLSFRKKHNCHLEIYNQYSHGNFHS